MLDHRLLLALATLMLLAACEKDLPPPVDVPLGGLTVRVTPEPARIEVFAPDGTPLFVGAPGGSVAEGAAPHVAFAFRRAEATYETQFGSFRILETAADPWRSARRLVDLVVTADRITFGLESEAGVRLGAGEVAAAGEGHVTITVTAADPAVNRASAAFGCAPEEHFLGLGGQSWDVDHRGQTVPLWVQEDGISKVDTDSFEDDDLWFLVGRRHSTHTPMPIFLSSRPYALLLDTPGRSVFSLCSEAEDVARVEAWEGALRLHVFHGGTPSATVERLTGHLGRPAVPPAFAFAPWLDALYGSENVRRVATALREAGVPVSAIWTEDWRGGVVDGLGYTLDEDWNLDRALYPDFELLAADLHDLGYKFLTYNNTFITKDVDVWPEAVAAGHTVQKPDGQPFTFTGGKFISTTLLDLTSPVAWDWAKAIYRLGLEQGADGFMADFAEWLPTTAVLHSGEDATAFHNAYPVEYQALNRELFDELAAEDGIERLFFVRSAYLGSQPLVSVVWAGDQQTDFTPGDGLPSVIPMGIGLGVTGFPYFGHDIGGYMSQLTDPTTKELWFRWVTLGALSPVMRTHHGKSAAENWNWESDAESTAHLARWAGLHQQLFPYLWALAHVASDTGLPLMRPLALAYPDLPAAWTATDQFMLGDRLIVAPVVEEGATSRTVALPPGRYYPLLGGPAVDVAAGDAPVEIEAPETEIPVLVPAGTVLVLLSEGVDTVVAAAAGSGVSTLADVADDREVWLWPGGESAFAEPGGLAYDWDAGTFDGDPAGATWNGTPVTFTAGVAEVVGAGTLVIGDATLVVTGGAADRRLWIHVRP